MVHLKFIIINKFAGMYRKFFLLSLLILACDFPERDCLSFQTGTFEYESISDDGVKVISEFTRTKDLEIGYFNGKIDLQLTQEQVQHFFEVIECIRKTTLNFEHFNKEMKSRTVAILRHKKLM